MLLNNLQIGYRQRGRSTHIVCADINTELQQGLLTCLIGPNGAGKSTLLRTLSAFQRPLKGKVEVCGSSLHALDSRQLARTIGIVLTQKPDLNNVSVRELVGIGRSPYTNFWGVLTDADQLIVDRCLALTGISHLANRCVHTLSDGERQKTMIAKALAQQTPYIILDEPTAFLDYPSKVELMHTLLRLCHDEGKTILLSTHDIELALPLADRLWLMMDGRFASGTPRQLADSGALSRFIDSDGIRFDTRTMQINVGK